jgi:hypothetical protein
MKDLSRPNFVFVPGGLVFHEVGENQITLCRQIDAAGLQLISLSAQELLEHPATFCNNCFAVGMKNFRNGADMNNGRLASIVTGLSGIARKVYDVVPLSETWSVQQISNELMRCGSRVDNQVIKGCLNSLLTAKVVYENRNGTFIKVRPKDATSYEAEPLNPVLTGEDMQQNSTSHGSTTPVRSPIEILECLEKDAKAIAALAKKFSDDIAGAAIAIQEQLEEAEGKSEKLKQLQALLKSL